jgi:hypothetical protein
MGHRSIPIKFEAGFIARDHTKENPGGAGVFRFEIRYDTMKAASGNKDNVSGTADVGLRSSADNGQRR